MNKQIWLVAGIAGMLLGNPAADANAAISVQIKTGSNPSFLINSAPNFIYLRSQGFSVSIGNPYDIVYYGDYYYIVPDRKPLFFENLTILPQSKTVYFGYCGDVLAFFRI